MHAPWTRKRRPKRFVTPLVPTSPPFFLPFYKSTNYDNIIATAVYVYAFSYTVKLFSNDVASRPTRVRSCVGRVRARRYGTDDLTRSTRSRSARKLIDKSSAGAEIFSSMKRKFEEEQMYVYSRGSNRTSRVAFLLINLPPGILFFFSF